MELENDLFEAAAADLEKAIQAEEEETPPDGPEAIAKAVKDKLNEAVEIATTGKLAKAGPASDMSADKDRRGTLTSTKDDPAKTPKKSGQGYKDSSVHTAEKGDDEHCDDDDTPAYFKKKGKKAKKAAKKADDEHNDDDDESSEDGLDADEFVEGMEKAIGDLRKGNRNLEEGLATFGELLSDMADPRKDKLLVTMAKGISHIVDRLGKLEKSVAEQGDLAKSIAKMPGMPRIAGLALAKSESAETAQATGTEGRGGMAETITDGDRERLFKAVVEKRISKAEHGNALRTGDLKCLEKAR